MRPTHTIDATNRPLGRLAGEIATLLRGKQRVDFEPRKDDGGVVFVKNVRQLRLTGKKLNQKIYYHHTGYPGGIKEVTMKKLFAMKPSEVLRKAVYGMLPNNKLRDRQITRLKFIKLETRNPKLET